MAFTTALTTLRAPRVDSAAERRPTCRAIRELWPRSFARAFPASRQIGAAVNVCVYAVSSDVTDLSYGQWVLLPTTR